MKLHKPTTPGRRRMTKQDFSALTKKEPEKTRLLALKKRAGRSHSGRITVRHRGGGVRRLYRIVDFGQKKLNIKGKIAALEYDPCRTAFIALTKYEDGDKLYQIAPQGIKIEDEIICSEKGEIKIGNRMKLKNIPVGTMVFNIELEPGKGGRLIRSAGAGAKVLTQEERPGAGYTHLEMSSKEIRKISNECYATIGTVSRPEWREVILGKAGRTRRKGRRPVVRGSAMNPCDHPHGGGEGRTSIGLPHPKTPTGKPALGVKTRKRKKWTNKLIIKRRNK